MSEKHWSDVMNEEYEAATTDKERLAALKKHMGHDEALTTLDMIEGKRANERKSQDAQVAQFIKDGYLRPAKPLPDGRPDEGSEDTQPQDEGYDD